VTFPTTSPTENVPENSETASPTEDVPENSETAHPTEDVPENSETAHPTEDVPENSETAANLPLEDLVGKWVVIKYDNALYPGIVEDEDENGAVKVNAMSCVGNNQFFWPRIRDEIWYDSIVSIIPEPQNVTKRHVQVEPQLWRELQSKLE